MRKHSKRKLKSIDFENEHPGCLWGMLHIFGNHHWRHVKKMLPQKRNGSGRHSMGNKINGDNADKMQEQIIAEMNQRDIEEMMADSSPSIKSSVKARIKALIAEEMSKKKGKRRGSSTSSVQSQFTQTKSTHHLEPSDQDPPTEIILNVERPRIAPQDNESSPATCTLDPLPPMASDEPVASKKKCEVCSTLLTVNHLGQSQADNEHGKQLVENHTILQEKLDKAKQALLEQKLMSVKKDTRDAPLYQSKEFLDALDIVNLNKELFLKILQDQGSPLAHRVHGRRAFSRKKRLAKSGSFPVAGLSGGRDSGPSELKNKLNESGSHAKGEEKLQVGSQAHKSADFKSAEDINGLSMPLMAENMVNGNSEPNQAKPESVDNAYPGLSLQMKNGSQNQVAIKSFKDLKQRLKHAIRESRKEQHRITMDAIFHKIPYGHKFSKDVKKEISCPWKPPAMDSCGNDSPASSYECDHSGLVLNKRPRMIRRTSSINDSLERYRQLYESSFNREARYHISERLKLRTEDVGLPAGGAPKSLARLLSLPDLTSYFYLPNEDSSYALSSGTPIRTFGSRTASIRNSFDERKTLEFPIGSENQKQLNSILDSGSQENLVEVSELYPVIRDQVGSASVANGEEDTEAETIIDDSGNLIIEDNMAHHLGEIGSISRLTAELAEPSAIPMVDSTFQEDITSHSKFSESEDAELKPRRLLFNGPDSLVDQHYESSMDSTAVAVELEKVELPSKHLVIDSLRVQVDIKDKADFNYVRDILELSGFSRNELLGMWHSADQPLDPSMYEEVEECLPHGHEHSENEEGGYCIHLLLFDLINEVLMQIYERSFTYYPKPLSSCTHIHPMPSGYHVLEQVWANISWYLSSKPELDQSLDYVVSRDLAKGDRWMDLQFDSEYVGIELEDLIFNDLLDEVIST